MESENGDMINEDWANLSYYKEENLKQEVNKYIKDKTSLI